MWYSLLTQWQNEHIWIGSKHVKTVYAMPVTGLLNNPTWSILFMPAGFHAGTRI